MEKQNIYRNQQICKIGILWESVMITTTITETKKVSKVMEKRGRFERTGGAKQ